MVIHHLLECTKPSDSSYISLEAEISWENDLKMVGKNPRIELLVYATESLPLRPHRNIPFSSVWGWEGGWGVVKIGLHEVCQLLSVYMVYQVTPRGPPPFPSLSYNVVPSYKLVLYVKRTYIYHKPLEFRMCPVDFTNLANRNPFKSH